MPLKAKRVQVNINQETFNCIKPTNLDIMFRIDNCGFIQFEKSSICYLPLLENRKKIK